MTRCGVCDKDAMFFTELYDNDNVFRKDGKSGLYILYLCEEHHKMMLRNLHSDLIRMQWNRVRE